MASIVFTTLKNVNKSTVGYTYSDLHLDIDSINVRSGPNGEVINGKDIQMDYDVNAVVNSIMNIFNTTPGERFLVPEFGSNLKKYLFEPISEYTANQIGNEIVYSVETWEPRVTVSVVNVIGRPEQHEYEVTLSLIINSIRKAVDIKGIIDVNNDVLLSNVKVICNR